MIRILHTGDWQLGMTRHYLDAERQALFTQARFEAIATIGRIARERSCELVVCCGDVFEDNQVDRRTVARACEALASIPVSTWLLPGNHDPFNAASVFRSATFAARKPANVTVFESATPVIIRPGVELVGAPWSSKRPLKDLVAAALEPLPALETGVRIVVAHGAMDSLSPDDENPALVSQSAAEQAIAAGKLHYLALGDRHSLTEVGSTGRIRYAGAPEPTDYDEIDPGCVLVVDVARDRIQAEPVRIGTWRYLRQRIALTDDADVVLLRDKIQALPDKARTVLKLDLEGTLTLTQKAALDALLEAGHDTLGALEISERGSDLHVVPGDADFADLGLSGFAARAVAVLRDRAAAGTSDGQVARDALGLLLRLARRA